MTTIEPSVRSKSLKETKARRSSMVVKVFSFNIQKNKLSKAKKEYLKELFKEAKFYYNYLIHLSQKSITDDFGNTVYPFNVFTFNTKSNLIKIYNRELDKYEDYELKSLPSQAKQELLKKIQSSIKALSKAKAKSRKIGRLKFKSFVSLYLKQFNNSFYLSDDCKKLSLQGNKKLSFHLVRNKNLSLLANRLGLCGSKGKAFSLKKLIDLKIVEVANSQLSSSYKKDSYVFNLTLYINPTYLAKANLFQGTKVSIEDKKIISNLNLGIDAGISSELTVNTGELYSSVSINSRELIQQKQFKQQKRLKYYQRQLNRHISKSKKSKKLGKSLRNNDLSKNNNKYSFRTENYKNLKQKINAIQANINNHKVDSINKLLSILDLTKSITFQDEMVKSWHKNKTMKFSNAIQKGILGKTYAKLKLSYDNKDNITNNYKYKKLSKSLRTTKTCICEIVNKEIRLKDRVFLCPQCGYKNDRDTHSSYIINHTLNHVDYIPTDSEYLQKEVLDCGMQSKDLILSSNLDKTITSTKTNKLYLILSSKLKSQNLSFKLNNFYEENSLEAPSFRAG